MLVVVGVVCVLVVCVEIEWELVGMPSLNEDDDVDMDDDVESEKGVKDVEEDELGFDLIIVRIRTN